MDILRPTIATGSIFAELDPERLAGQLKARGCRAGTIDLDSTVVAQQDMQISPANISVIKGFFENDLPLGIDSNTGSELRDHRARSLADQMSNAVGEEVPTVTTYQLGGWWLRKPSRRPFDVTAARMGVPNRNMFHIDDQIFKGVLCANRAGYGASVHVLPCAPGSDPVGVRYFQRHFENRLLEKWQSPFGMTDFDENGALVSPAAADETPETPEATADGYRRAKLIYYATAVAAAGVGVGETTAGQTLPAILGELSALGFLDAALMMKGYQKRQHVVEKLLEIGERAHQAK